MAKIFPTLENIQRLKVKPTEGEWFLIKHLIQYLSDDIEIYFQPFLNGDMPDIILMQKNVGVTIIEVKDWNLDLYRIDEDNKWYLKQNNALLKSPFKQVFSYKNNMFNLHMDGLLEEKIKNNNFYQRINVCVYFHKATKNNLNDFFNQTLLSYKDLIDSCNKDYKKFTSHQQYEKKIEYLKQKKSKIERDLRLSVGNDNLKKITLPQGKVLFTDEIYQEFHRYLQPPYHAFEQLEEITYTAKQEKLIVSNPIHQKIKGVAGSGKTVVLAKRAVNAHKRHEEVVLILTFNITLKSYIHDRISDVRDGFSWGAFYINNYHQFIMQLLNNLNIDFEIPENLKGNELVEYFDKYYFSNEKLFEINHKDIPKYKSIFIDEIQDYKPEWIKIIRKYFLEDDGEMVLFGDEKQNIYDRELDSEKKIKTVKGFGKWEILNKSIRHKGNGSRILNLAKRFQKSFFENKYELDNYKNIANSPSLNLGTYKIEHYEDGKLDILVQQILSEIRLNNLHNDDVVILGSKIDSLKEIDYLIRTTSSIKTLTTFETKEMGKYAKNEVTNIRKRKKIGFNHHSGKLKISTVHSFKGYEADTVFLIIDDGNERSNLDDNEEMIYVGITRSLFNIMVFTKKESKYNKFFNVDLETSSIAKNKSDTIDTLEVTSLVTNEVLSESKSEVSDEVVSDVVLETLSPISKTGLVFGGVGLLFGLPF